MRLIRLYLPLSWSKVGQSMPLPDDAKHYITTVLRARDGFNITLFDGMGKTAQATLQLGKKTADVLIDSIATDTSKESPLSLILAQGISRGERMDTSLQKATELGVTQIQPLFTQYTEVKLEDEDKTAKRMAHWQQVIVSACEQSGRNVVPLLHAPLSLAEWLDTKPQGLVLDPYQGGSIRQLSKERFIQPQSLLIGPEGGLSDKEVSDALHAGLIPIQLGKRILRTETAGPAYVTAIQACFGDM
jgi:16S rRNA (uracil1498-N3)-methyltransferase